MEPRRLLIVEEALKDRKGHWFEYNLAIANEARRQGVQVTILAHKDIQRDVREELDAVPFFPVTSWDHVYDHPSELVRYLGILRHNLRVIRWMSRHFSSIAKPYDVVLVPTVVLYHWIAWRWLASRGCDRDFRKLVLTTRNNAGEYDPVTRTYNFRRSAKVLKTAVSGFAPLVRTARVQLASDSSILCKQFEQLCGLPFVTYPHPRVPVLANSNHQLFDSRRPLTFSALGPPRFEKGSDLILGAIPLVRKLRPDLNLRFVLQWSDRAYEPGGREITPASELEQDGNIEWIRRDLNSAEYLHYLRASDALLLPYRRAQYHARISGVAIEAFQAGIPCIAFTDTWLAEALNELGSGVLVEVEDTQSVAAAIISIADHKLEFQKRAHARKGLALSTHSPEAFVAKLFEGAAT